MKPYYEEPGFTIYCGDCRELLPTILLVGEVDLVVTDPPYGIALQNHNEGRSPIHHRRRKAGFGITGDENTSLGQAVLDSVDQYPVITFASPMKPWKGDWRQYLVWDKGPAVGGGGDVATCWKMTWELIQISDTLPLNGTRDEAVLRFHVSPCDSLLHPAQKPEALLRYLIYKASGSRATILDPFMGIGTTLRAAKELGKSAIGIEIEERYCEIAANRLAQSVFDFGSAEETAPVAEQLLL